MFQEAQIAISEKYMEVQQAEVPEARALTIAKGVMIDEIRRIQRRAKREMPIDWATPLVDTEIEAFIEGEQMEMLIGSMVESGRLSKHQALALALHMSGRDSADMGEVLGCSPETARVHLMRAREKLKSAMDRD